MADTVADIAIGVSMDISALQSGVSKGSTALAAMEKSSKALALQIDKIGASGVKFQAQVNSFAGVATNIANSARSSADAFADAFAAFDAAQATVDRLRASFDPVFAASKRYEAAVKELDAALDMGVISGNQHAQMLDRMGKAYLGAGAEVDRAGAGLGRMGGMTDGTRAKLQQVGFQVQDFAVQVGAGTSATQAFAQQFPQLAGAFGPVGVMLGTLAAVAIPVAVAAFGKMESAADTLTTSQNNLETSIGALRGITAELADLDELAEKYGAVDAVLLQLIAHQREQQITSAQTAARDAVRALADEYGVASGALNLFRVTGAGAASDIADALGFTRDQMLAFQIALRDAQSATTFEEQADALARVDGYLQRSTISSDDMARVITQVALSMREVDEAAGNSADAIVFAKGEGGNLNKVIIDTAIAMNELLTAAPDGGWLDSAIADASTLAERLWDGARAAQMARLGDTPGLTGPAGMGSSPPTGGAVGKSIRPGRREIDFDYTSPTEGGGVGGGTSNSELDALIDSLATEQEILDEWYAESAAMFANASDAQLAALGGRHEAIERLEQEHQERLSGIRGGGDDDALSNAASFFGSLATITQNGGEKANKAYRAFVAAEALINTYRGAAAVLGDKTVPFFAKFGAVRSIIGAGMGFVNALKGGGSSSGGSSRAPSVSSAGAASIGPMSVANITLVGDTFSKSSVEDLFKQINEGLKTGRTINLVTV